MSKLATIFWLLGCGGPQKTPAGTASICTARVEAAVKNHLDVLIVIDDSPPAASLIVDRTARIEQIAKSLAAMAAAGEKWWLHIGVTTAGSDGLGKLRAPAACGLRDAAPFIDVDEAGNVSNLPLGTDLATAIGCLADVGTTGSVAAPLETAYLATKMPPLDDAGFLRNNALLAIVIVNAGDDMSADGSGPIDLDRYLQAFSQPKAKGGVKNNPDDLLWLSTTCGAAPRLESLARSLAAARPLSTAVAQNAQCAANLGDAFSALFPPPAISDIGPACFPTLISDCVVEEHRYASDGRLAIAEIPACESGGPLPCFRFVSTSACVNGNVLHIDRDYDVPRSESVELRVECVCGP